jgi:hypothetical protein
MPVSLELAAMPVEGLPKAKKPLCARVTDVTNQ